MSTTQWRLGVALGALALGSCARNLCESDADDPRCLMAAQPQQTAVSVSPTRLSLRAGGQLTVTVSPAPPLGSTVVLRRTNAKDLMLGSATGGELLASVKSADLNANNFTAGAAQVVLVQPDDTELAAPLRLVIEPQLTQPAKVYDTTPDSDYPIWIAINQANTIYTLNQYPPFTGATERQLRLGEYQLVNNLLAMRTPQTFGAYKGYPFQTQPMGQAVLNGTNVVVLSRNPLSGGNPIAADRCVFATGQCQAINPGSFSFNGIVGLASDRKGSLFAVQSDAGTLAYRGSDMNPFTDKLAIDNANKPAAGTIVTMAVGDVDGDAQSDLVLFQAMPTGVSVFLSTGNQLRYSDTRSAALQSALGGRIPVAAAVADMDADGLADLVLLQNGAISMLFNLGSSWAASAMPVPALMNADSLAVGTIQPSVGTGGKPGSQMDIAVASSTGRHIAVLINQASF